MAIGQIPFDNRGHMTRRSRAVVFFISTPLVVLILVGGLLGQTRVPENDTVRHLRVFSDVQNRILGAYVEPANIETVMDGAMRGLAESLDPATSYLTPEEVRFVESRAALPAGDVGLVVTRQYYLRVAGVRDGSPAAKAGIMSGDFIRAIDEKPTRDMSVFAGTRLLRGAPGSSVKVLVIRSNPADPHEFTLVRETPKADRASARTLPGGEAYLRVSSFEAGAAAAIRNAVTSLGPAASAGLIVDLRDVADGPLEEGIAAARPFVKTSGVLATRITRNSPPAVARSSMADGTLGMKVVLLVSNGTGRAAEIFAAALANNERADLVGEPTAGMASTQRLVKLIEGHGLYLTTERYVQADHSPLDGRGLRPTFAVDMPPVDFGAPLPSTDAALVRAIDVLRGRAGPPTAAAAPGTSAPNTPAQVAPPPGGGPPRDLPPTPAPGQDPAPSPPLPRDLPR